MNLGNYIDQNIEEAYISINEFGDIAIYLMDNGVMCREDSKIERDLYDKFVRIKDEMMQYFSVIGVELHHNEEFFSVRAYAPDSIHPNSDEIKDDEGSSYMRLPVNKELAASLLVCYLLYEQYRSEGRLENDFTAVVRQYEFVTAHAAMLGIDVAQKGNRNISVETYRALKKLRAIKYNPEFFNSDEYPLIIRPYIFDIVSEENLQSLEGRENED